MKTMKWIVTVFMVIGMVATSYAQQTGRMPVDEVTQLQTQLKLTDAQTAKVKAVIQQIKKEQTDDKTTQANMKKWTETHNMKAISDYLLKQMDIESARIKPILTTGQKKIFEGMLTKSRDVLKKMAASQQ